MSITTYAAIDSSAAKTGADQFNAALNSMRGGVASANGSFGQLGNNINAIGLASKVVGALGLAALATAAYGAAKAAVQASDSYTLLQGRLAIVLPAGENVKDVLGRLADASDRARVPFAGLAQSFQNNYQALTALKFSTEDQIKFSESLAKTLTISGVAGEQASAGMLQLSQALVSNRLQGDEFRSVAENFPELLRIISKETGKTAKELRELAEQGRIAGKTIVQSVLNAGQDIENKFVQVPQTAGAAFSKLYDTVSRTFGKIGEESGASQKFADAINSVTNAVNSPDFKSGAKVFVDFLASIPAYAKQAVNTLNDLVTFANAFAEKTGAKSAVKSAVSDLASAVAGTAVFAVQQASAGFATVTGYVDNLTKTYVPELRKQFDEASASVAKVSDDVSKQQELTRAWVAEVQAAKGKVEFGSGLTSEEIKRVKEQLVVAQAENALNEQKVKQNFVIAGQLELQFQYLKSTSKELRDGDAALAGLVKKELERAAAIKQQEFALKTVNQLADLSLNNQLQQAEIAGNDRLVDQLKVEIAARQQITEEARQLQPELARQIEQQIALGVVLDRQKTRTSELQSFGENATRTISSGFLEAIKNGDGFANTLKNITTKLIDLIVQFALLEPLARDVGRIFSGGSLATSSATGGIGGLIDGIGNLGGFLGFAKGGIVQQPTKFALGGVLDAASGPSVGLAGESGPEVILPLRRDPSGSLGVSSSGGRQTSAAPVTINVYGDASDSQLRQMREVARDYFGQASPAIVRQSVAAVQQANRADPMFMRR